MVGYSYQRLQPTGEMVSRRWRQVLAFRPPLRIVIRVLAGIVVSVVVFFFWFQNRWRWHSHSLESVDKTHELPGPVESSGEPVPQEYEQRQTPVRQALQDLFQPLLVPPTAPRVRAQDGDVYALPRTEGLPFPERLGKKLCILDMDGRSFDGQNEVFSDAPLDVGSQPGASSSSGIMNHFLYANVHGYTYKFIRTGAPPEERSNVWMEVTANLEMLEKSDCEIVVTVDADVIFAHLEIPLEWLFNRWNFTAEHHVCQALDPNRDVPLAGLSDFSEIIWYFRDNYGVTWPNPGFIVLRNTQLVREMLRAWWECPEDEARYPGCRRWISGWPAEMGAFGNHIRYDPRFRDALLELPCNEANGHPDYHAERIPCQGLWVRHYAGHDPHLHGGFVESTVRGVANVLHREMAARKEEWVQDQGKIDIRVG